LVSVFGRRPYFYISWHWHFV